MANGSSCDVLVVEDDVIQCEEMAGFLSRAGLAVGIAHNAASGLKKAAVLQPRVALLDFNLPDMTGVELAEHLRGTLPSLAILMMSGRVDGVSEQTLGKLGVTVFANKPLPLGPLRQAVLKLVRGDTARRHNQQRSKGWLAAGLGGTPR